MKENLKLANSMVKVKLGSIRILFFIIYHFEFQNRKVLHQKWRTL